MIAPLPSLDRDHFRRTRPCRVLLWADTTARQPFETGIQRVTRRLAVGLAAAGLDVAAVGWDPARRLIIDLASSLPVATPLQADAWLVVPEVPLSLLGENLDPVQLGGAFGLRTAVVVHDLIPVTRAQDYDCDTRRTFGRYYRMVAVADLALTTTRHVAQDLARHLGGEGLKVPRIAVEPLPAQFGSTNRRREGLPKRKARDPLRLLTVSTWEPRKNITTLLRGVQAARERTNAPITLTLVGRRRCFPAYDAQIMALLAVMPWVAVQDCVSDAELAALYGTHHASVYPSLEEGFGLPILESLWLGRPCFCHHDGAMAEVAPGGGTVLLDMSSVDGVASALAALAERPRQLTALTAELQQRPLRDWDAYAQQVTMLLRAPTDLA